MEDLKGFALFVNCWLIFGCLIFMIFSFVVLIFNIDINVTLPCIFLFVIPFILSETTRPKRRNENDRI